MWNSYSRPDGRQREGVILLSTVITGGRDQKPLTAAPSISLADCRPCSTRSGKNGEWAWGAKQARVVGERRRAAGVSC